MGGAGDGTGLEIMDEGHVQSADEDPTLSLGLFGDHGPARAPGAEEGTSDPPRRREQVILELWVGSWNVTVYDGGMDFGKILRDLDYGIGVHESDFRGYEVCIRLREDAQKLLAVLAALLGLDTSSRRHCRSLTLSDRP